MPKGEDRSGWVAVESDVSGKAGPNIKPAMNAYMFFQKARMSAIRKALQDEGVEADFARVQQETAARWKALSDAERQPFEEEARDDRERYDLEQERRDREFEAERAARQAASAAPVEGPRERKQRVEQVKRKPRVMKELTEEQKERKAAREAEWAARRKEREAEEAVLEAQKRQLADEKKAAAKKRLAFLVGQSEIFKHFLADGEDAAAFAAVSASGSTSASASASASGAPPASPRRAAASASASAAAAAAAAGSPSKRQMASEREEDRTLLEAEANEAEEVVRFTEHPSFLSSVPGTMRAYQVEGLNWLVQLNSLGLNGILADEMGLGKTLQSISILGYQLAAKRISGPHLVVCPKSCLSNWMNELKRWCPELRPVRLHGSREEREELLTTTLRPRRADADREFDVCVTTYEIVNIEKNTLSKHIWQYIVIDEAHRLKNDASLFSQNARALQARNRLLLTGTPLQNNLHELWALLNFLMPEVFGDSDTFDRWFDLETDDDAAKKQMVRQLHRVLRPFMLRRLKAHVEKSLPPKTETLLFVGMSQMQRELYKKILLRESDAVTANTKGHRGTLQNVVMQLRKACNHPYLFDGQEDMELDPLGDHLMQSCGKLVLLSKLLHKLRQRKSRVLIFSQMTRVLDILEDYMRMPQHEYSYCRIDGGTEHEDRERQIDEFNAPGSEHFAFLLSTRAGGLGINLYTADVVVLYDSDWNPQADLQAMDRAHRIGQTKPVSVYRLVTESTIEEKIVERAQQKLKLDAVVMQSGRLPEKGKQVTAEEMLAAVRFGADKVFRSEGSTITDDDIDFILSQGERRTAEMKSKLEEVEKGDVLDFRLDQGFNTSEFEGENYEDKRVELKTLIAQQKMIEIDAMGKRERRQVMQMELESWGDGGEKPKVRRSLLPAQMRLPRMDPHQFFERARLLELQEVEEARFLELSQLSEVPEGLTSLLPDEMEAEKQRLLAAGFHWTRGDFRKFVRASSRFGRAALAQVAQEIGRPLEETQRYAAAFWELGEGRLGAEVWKKARERIEFGERKLKAVEGMREATRLKVARFRRDPWELMELRNPRSRMSDFTVESCRYLLTFVQLYGYGNWDRIHAAVRRCEKFRFDFWLQSRTVDEIRHECERLMKEAEKENTEALKKGAEERRRWEREAEERRAFIQKDAVEQEERDHRRAQLQAQIAEIKAKFERECEERLKRLEDGGTAADGSVPAGPLLKQGLAKAAKKVLGAGGGGAGGKGTGGARADDLGNPLLPVLVKFAPTLAGGCAGMPKIAAAFIAKHPAASKAWVERCLKLAMVKEKRGKDTKARWYARPGHAKGSPAKKKSGTKRASPAKGKSPKAKKAKPAKNPKSKPTPKGKASGEAGETKVKRSYSAYVHYSLGCRKKIKDSLPEDQRSQKDILDRLRQTWNELTPEGKLPWEEKARADRERYKRETAAEEEEQKAKVKVARPAPSANPETAAGAPAANPAKKAKTAAE